MKIITRFREQNPILRRKEEGGMSPCTGALPPSLPRAPTAFPESDCVNACGATEGGFPLAPVAWPPASNFARGFPHPAKTAASSGSHRSLPDAHTKDPPEKPAPETGTDEMFSLPANAGPPTRRKKIGPGGWAVFRRRRENRRIPFTSLRRKKGRGGIPRSDPPPGSGRRTSYPPGFRRKTSGCIPLR